MLGELFFCHLYYNKKKLLLLTRIEKQQQKLFKSVLRHSWEGITPDSFMLRTIKLGDSSPFGDNTKITVKGEYTAAKAKVIHSCVKQIKK